MAWTSKASDSILNSISATCSRIMRITVTLQFSPYGDSPLNVAAPLMLLPRPALRHCQHSLSEPALFVGTGKPKKHEKEQLRREIEEAKERQNRAEREMQANISRRETRSHSTGLG